MLQTVTGWHDFSLLTTDCMQIRLGAYRISHLPACLLSYSVCCVSVLFSVIFLDQVQFKFIVLFMQRYQTKQCNLQSQSLKTSSHICLYIFVGTKHFDRGYEGFWQIWNKLDVSHVWTGAYTLLCTSKSENEHQMFGSVRWNIRIKLCGVLCCTTLREIHDAQGSEDFFLSCSLISRLNLFSAP